MDLRQPYLALKINLAQGRSFDTHKTTKKQKGKQKDTYNVFFGTGGNDVELSEEEGKGVLHNTNVKNILHWIFSNAEFYITNNQIVSLNGLYAHQSDFPIILKSTVTGYKSVLHREGYDYDEYPTKLNESPLFTRRMKLCNRPDGLMLYGKLDIDFFTTSELLYPSMKVRIRLIRARPKFYILIQNPNVSLGNMDCSLYTRRMLLQENNQKKEWLN